MHDASTLRIPADAIPTPRPRRAPGSPHLPPEVSGIWDRRSLLRSGFTDAEIRLQLRLGRLVPAGRGRYASGSADPRTLRALRAGYRPTCVDAAFAHKLWIPDGARDQRAHVYRKRDAEPAPRWADTHRPWLTSWPEADPIASVPVLLAHALRCQEPETTAILMESALHQGLILPDDLMSLIHEAPVAARRTFHSLSTASESGSETRVVRWLRHRGFQVEQQVFIEEVGYVDAYAGGVVLEMDGRTYHSSPEAFAEDRRRDLVMRRLGLQPIRLSYGQIWHDWRRTRVALLDAITEAGATGRRAFERATTV